MSKSPLEGLFVLALTIGQLSWVSPANACGNETYVVTEGAAYQEAVAAERFLEKGQYLRALERVRWLDATIPSGGSRVVREEAVAPLYPRLLRVEAVVYLRTGRARLAEEILQDLLSEKPEDPYLKARYAEALAKLHPPFRSQKNLQRARQIMEDLARADLLPDGDAYLTLANLREVDNDLPGRDQALATCRKRHPDPKACERRETPPAKKQEAPVPKQLLKAEELLASGSYPAALYATREVFPDDPKLIHRRDRVKAIAYLETKRASLSVRLFKDLLFDDHLAQEPLLWSKYAEGLSRLAADRVRNKRRAVRLLEALHQGGSLDEAGQKVLAQLR